MSEPIIVTSPSASCHVFTFKEGLLSGVAHDLKIVVERCSISYWPGADSQAVSRIEASFDPKSLRVVCAQRDGHDQPSALSADNRAEIERNILRDVLQADRFSDIRFVSSQVSDRAGSFEVVGELTLHGQRRTLTAQVRRQGDRWVSSLRLHQPDFGIKPYSAAFGTLRVKPELLLTVSIPAT